jgi:4-amino-4-deoxy-L-arabinose transferase-like glycosyltransferase
VRFPTARSSKNIFINSAPIDQFMSAVQPSANRTSTPLWTWWALLAITLVAAGLRLWRLDQLPPGLFFDEAYNGLDARSVAEGARLPLYFTGNNGREPLYIYLQAVMVALLGPTPYALRLTSALIGIVTIPLTYFCARVWLQGAGDRDAAPPAWLVWPALIAAAGMAISFWHVSLSRLAFRVVLLPALSLPALAFFWLAWTGGRRRDYVWSGIWFGLALYSYLAARLLPFVVLAFVVIELIIALLARHEDFRPIWRRRIGGLGWLMGAGLLVSLPLLIAVVQDPALISARTGDVSILTASQTDMPGTPGQRFVANTGAIARSFYDRGDQNLRHNLSGRPVQDWWLAALFTVGWLAALWRVREARMRLLLLWFAIMALPSLLSTDAPHALRMAGMLPPLALLYGVGAQAIQHLARRRIAPNVVGGVLLAIVLCIGGALTVRDYFGRWSADPGLGQAFDLEQQLAAHFLARELDAGDGAFVTTRRLFLTPQMRFALGEVPAAESTTGLAAEGRFLAEAEPDPFQPHFLASRRDGILQASWVATTPPDALARLAMEDRESTALAWPEQQADWPGLRTGPLPPTIGLAPGLPRYPLDVTFANGLQLVGYDVTPDGVIPGEGDASVRLATYWRLPSGQAPPPDSFDLFAHLLLADGTQIQENGNLGRGYPVDLWQAGQVVDDRRSFVVPAPAPPGKATFEIGLFDPAVPDGAARIAIVDDSGAAVADHVTLGAVAVDLTPPQAPMTDLQTLDVIFDEGIRLAGWSAQPSAGDATTLAVDLAWESLDRVTSDYTAFVHLLDPAGTIVAQYDQPPGGAENPTTRWLPGESVRMTFPLIDALPLGEGYSLRVGLYEPVSGRQLPVTGGDAEPGATFTLLPLEALP